MKQWFPFRVVRYGDVEDSLGGNSFAVMSADDPDTSAVLYDCESEEKARGVCAILNAAHSFIAFSRAHGGPYAVPHDASCADTRHDHTGSRYDAAGTYLGRWVADHECPPCDCGAQALVTALTDGQST